MTINEFVRSMADAGFEFNFKAQNGDITIVGESIMCNDGKCVVKKRKVLTADESRKAIKTMFNKDKTI